MQDSGLTCLLLVAQYHHLPLDEQQLRHQFAASQAEMTGDDILRASKQLGFKAKRLKISTAEQVEPSLLPCIVRREGRFQLLLAMKYQQQTCKAVFYDPLKKQSHITQQLEQGVWLDCIFFRKNFLEHSLQRFNLRWFYPALIKYKRLFAEVLLASLFLQIFALLTPLFFQVVMDKVLVHQGYTTLDVLAIGFFAVAVFEALLGGIRNYVFAHTSNRIDVELGAKLFRHLMALPMAWFNNRQAGHTVARVRELETIRNFITGSALTLLVDVAFSCIFLAVMWYYSWQLTVLVCCALLMFAVLSAVITPALKHRLEQKFQHGAENQAFLVESITGVQTLKSLAVEPQMQRKWEDRLAQYVNAAFRAQNLSNIAGQLAGFINKLMTLGIIWWGAHLVIAQQLTVGQLVAFNMLAARLSGPVMKLVQLWQDFQQAGISLKRLGDILNTAVESGFDAKRSVLPEFKGELKFEGLNFRYHPESALVLNNIDLHIRCGESIGIVGRSGSGKSTLSALLQRFYLADSGRLLIDGVDIRVLESSWLRKNIGVVLQDNILFNCTVRENIALANPGLPMKKIIDAAKLAGADEFINTLPNAYDSLIQEQGSNLSGGQRQRIAIARALVSDPKLLIFDEASSALDYESERLLQNNMQQICNNRTVLIIAHRLSAVQNCDRIIVMDKGEIIEQGNHQQLLAAQGFYAELHRMQSWHSSQHNTSNSETDLKVDAETNSEARAA